MATPYDQAQDAVSGAGTMAISYLQGYVAERHGGDLTHVADNIRVIKDVFREDLSPDAGTEGTLTEAFLMVVGDFVQILVEQIAGPTDPARQQATFQEAVRAYGDRVHTGRARLTVEPPPSGPT